MAERDFSHGEILFSDVPGDGEKVRAILSQWGVEESSIRRLMREHRADVARNPEAKTTGHETRLPKHADN
ncbi:MAG TPA: hypothetical protein VEX60_19025 [Pyrinomonadaceae bacterium]|nr:hypothetical protein [Pyrinomonadaceae bacterium]